MKTLIFLLTFGCISDAFSRNSWILESDNLPSDRRFYPTIANGYIGTIVYGQSMHITGVYNGRANASSYEETSTHCRIPNPIAFRMELPKNISYESKFRLNLYDGVFTEELNTDDWRIRATQYVHQIYKTLLIVDIRAKAKVSEPGAIRIGIQRLTMNESMISDMEILKKRSERGKSLIKYRPLIQEDPSVQSPIITIVSTDLPSVITIDQHSPKSRSFILAAVIDQSDHIAYADLDNGLHLARSGHLYQSHVTAWHQLWDEGGRVDVDEEDIDLSRTIHAAQYYLISSSPTDPYDDPVHGWPNFGLSPASLAHSDEEDEHYFGHIFWDQETWMLPALLPFHPDIVRRIEIETRIRRLNQARAKAAVMGYQGAMFPWEVGYSGMETTNWEPAASREIHITGDIVQFLRQYMYWTNDTYFLIEGGAYSLIYESARFWSSRLSYIADRDAYGAKDVMGPDEHHDHVDNSAYTNVIAAISLSVLEEFYERLQRENRSMEVLEPEAIWAEMAAKIYVPFDEELGVHLEYDGYENGTMIKQADVILLGYPLSFEMHANIRKNDLQLYELNTIPTGPCMTWSMHSIGWLDLNDERRAARNFLRNFDNIHGPFKIWTENGATSDGAVNFITGIGGFLQNVLYGYLGLRAKSDRLNFAPRLLPTAAAGVGGKVGYRVSRVKYQWRVFDFRVSAIGHGDQGMVMITVDRSDRMDYCRLYDYASGIYVSLRRCKRVRLGMYAIKC